MIKIEIPLEDIVEGEKFKSQLVEAFTEEGLMLQEKQEGLYSDDLPGITSICSGGTDLICTMEHADKTYEVSVPEAEPGIMRAGLSFIYGMGFARYDYDLPLFKVGISEGLHDLYIKLGLEIWERNIHLDWMRSKGYGPHNGTKDSLFLRDIIKDWPAKQEAITMHNERSDRGEKGDTPHHIFRDPKILRRVIAREGKHPKTEFLIESIYDQATATTRIWYPFRGKPFEQRLIENMNEGYYIRRNEQGKVERWKPGVFGPKNNFEDELWGVWCQAHEEFKQYWIEKFGPNEKLWQPPAPKNKLE